MAKNGKFSMTISLTRPQFETLMSIKKGQHEQGAYHRAILGRMRGKGYVTYPDDWKVDLTEAGRALLLLMFHESGMDLDAELLRYGYSEGVKE